MLHGASEVAISERCRQGERGRDRRGALRVVYVRTSVSYVRAASVFLPEVAVDVIVATR